jgi:hypothetical protein
MEPSVDVITMIVNTILSSCQDSVRLEAEEKLLELLEWPHSTPHIIEILKNSSSTQLLFVLGESLAKSKLREFGFGIASPSTYEPSGSENDEFATSTIFIDKKTIIDATFEVLYTRYTQLPPVVVNKSSN